MKHFTEDFSLKTETIRELLKATYANYRMAVSIASEAGLLEKEELPETRLTVYSYDIIMDIMKEYFQLDLQKKTRVRNYVDARHIACYIFKKYTNLSHQQIATLI
jgi:chromosomal replication initiation ATPase DnaA